MNAEELRDKIVEALQGGSFPGNAAQISKAISSYVEDKGTPLPPTIRYTLAPCSGIGWEALIPLASEKGVGSSIISVGVAAEFAASTKVIPGPEGVQVVPMVFNTSAKVSDLTKLTDFREVWLEISKAIIEFFKTEIK